MTDLNKAVEEILHHLTNQAYYSDADYAEATQALLELINIALTLEELGHEVIRIQEDGLSSYELSDKLDDMYFDLFLFTRTWGKTVQLYHLENLRLRGIPNEKIALLKGLLASEYVTWNTRQHIEEVISELKSSQSKGNDND